MGRDRKRNCNVEGTERERKREQFNYSIIETLIWILFNKNIYFLANMFIFLY